MLGQKPCQRANCVSGAPCKVLNMFSEAPRRARSPSARCFVCSDSADVFWLACPRCVLCAEGTAGIVLFLFFFFCYSGSGDTSKLFWSQYEVPIVYCQSRHCCVCMCTLHGVCIFSSCFLLFLCIDSGAVYANVCEITVKKK